MKRSLSWLLVLTMLLACLGLTPAMAADENKKCVDIVIVLDQSKSMRQETNAGVDRSRSSDPDGYRIDAAQILIAMADMQGSRVAVVPFNQKVVANDTSFAALDSEPKRNTKINALKSLPGLQPDTDYGEALAVAYNLIANRPASDQNAPVIILLTDGEISMTNAERDRKTKPIYEWNSQSQKFVLGESAVPTTAIAQALADKAVEKCAEAGIPIYVIALTPPDATGNEDYIDDLRGYSRETGGRFESVDNEKVNLMPSYFAKVFADMVGSSLQQELTAQVVDAKQRLYEVEVPILNSSVMEANLFLSLDKVQANSIKLIDNNGKDASNSSSVITETSSHFRMYKLKKLKETDVGTWKLQFVLKGNAEPSEISFNLLYNYNLQLTAEAGKNMASLSNSLTNIAKTDKLHVEVKFKDLDTNRPTTDKNLYKAQEDRDDDAWKYIQAKWELRYAANDAAVKDENGNKLTGTLAGDMANCRFYTTIDLGTLVKGLNNTNGLTSGNYYLYVTAEGAGIMQESRINLGIVNQAPVGNAFYETIKVADGEVEGSYEPKAWTYDFGTLCNIRELDRDELTFAEIRVDSVTVGDQPGANANALLDWDPYDFADDGIVTFTTKKDAEGNMLHGEMKMTLIVQDSEHAQTEIPATIRVDSTEFNAAQGEFSLDPAQTVDADKNAEITLTAKAVPSAEVASDGGTVTAKIEEITGIEALSQEALDQINAAMTSDGTNFTFKVPTGNRKGDWTVVVGFYYNDHRLLVKDATISVGNAAPVLNADKLAEIPTDVKFGGSFVSFLEPDTTEEELTVNLAELFTDTAFNEKAEDLTYAVSLIDGAGNEIASENSLLKAELNGSVVTMKAEGMGSVTVRFSVTDVDGEAATAEVTITTANMTLKWSMLWAVALAALVVLIVLLRAIHWARLPRFRNIQLQVTEGQSITPTVTIDVPPGKRPERLRNYAGDLAANYHLEGFDQICIKPMRRRDGAVNLYMEKKAPAITVMLEGTEELLPGKKNMLVWCPEQKLYIQPAGGGEGLNILLHSTENIMPYSEPANNGWDGGVTNANLGFGESVAGTGFDSGFDSGFDAGFGGSSTDNAGFGSSDSGDQSFDSSFGGEGNAQNNDIGF